MRQIAGAGLLARPWLEKTAELRRSFREAEPYGHLVLDGFLSPRAWDAVASEFPRPERMRRSGAGSYAERAYFRRIHELGPASRELDLLLHSRAFLDWISAIVGRGPLIRNVAGTCGGLFQDPHGAELDAHLDVNCTLAGYRRRASLILYLNRSWREEWGGQLRLHRSPAEPARRELRPAPNRCVLLACHERAWHGVAKIALPRPRRRLGRRALIVNFYGKERAGADAPAHYNTWMPAALPQSVRPGAVLSASDRARVARLLERRLALLGELRGLEGSAAKPSRGEEATAIPRRALTSGDARALRRLFAACDRELRRGYAREYALRSAS